MRLSDAFMDEEFNEAFSETIRKTVDAIITEHNLDDRRWESLLVHTHIHHTDGTISSFAVEPKNLSQVSFLADDEVDDVFVMPE